MDFYAVRKPESEIEELYHHGIKGQKWGIRRFQNPDGTWKFAGKKRRRLSADAQARADRKTEIKNLKSKSDLDTAKASYKVTKERNKQAVKAAKADTASIGKKIKGSVKDQIEKKKAQKKEETADEIIRSGDLNKVIKNKDKLTNEQLNDAIRRMELEQKLSDVDAKKKQSGVDAYKRFADTVGTTANMTSNGITIYNNVAKVLNAFTDKELPTIGSGNQQSATDRAMAAARLRTANAAATTAEINARRAQQQEASERSQMMREGRENAAEGFRRFRENRRQAEERAHETYRNVSAQTRENIARAEQREAEGNARDAAIRELERTAPARANAGFHEFRAARRAAEEASSIRPSALPGPTMSAARTLVDNILDREDNND